MSDVAEIATIRRIAGYGGPRRRRRTDGSGAGVAAGQGDEGFGGGGADRGIDGGAEHAGHTQRVARLHQVAVVALDEPGIERRVDAGRHGEVEGVAERVDAEDADEAVDGHATERGVSFTLETARGVERLEERIADTDPVARRIVAGRRLDWCAACERDDPVGHPAEVFDHVGTSPVVAR